jgi:hypothetical protein
MFCQTLGDGTAARLEIILCGSDWVVLLRARRER